MSIGPDRVQVLKQESVSGGGDAADDVVYTTPLQPQEDALEAAGYYVQDGANRDETVFIERSGVDLRFVDGANPAGFSLSQLATGGSGITEGQHAALDTLVHGIAENSDLEVVRSGGQVTSLVYWTSVAHTTKIREIVLTRTSGRVTSVTTYQYNGAGVLVSTSTKAVTRSVGQVASILEVIS